MKRRQRYDPNTTADLFQLWMPDTAPPPLIATAGALHAETEAELLSEVGRAGLDFTREMKRRQGYGNLAAD